MSQNYHNFRARSTGTKKKEKNIKIEIIVFLGFASVLVVFSWTLAVHSRRQLISRELVNDRARYKDREGVFRPVVEHTYKSTLSSLLSRPCIHLFEQYSITPLKYYNSTREEYI